MTPCPRRHFSVVSETYPPEVNGVALTVARLVGGLRARGHTVSVVRPRQRAWVDAGAHDPALTVVRGVRLPRYAWLQMGLPANGVLRDRWTRHRPDAIYVATPGPLGCSALWTARRLGLPVLSGFHTNFHGYSSHYRAAWLERVLLCYLRGFHNRTRGTVVATADLRDRLRALGFANLRVLGRGVDTELFTPARRSPALRRSWGASGEDLVVLSVGRIAPEKNLPLALAAYRAMRRLRPSLRFVVAGDGPAREALQRANPDVIFPGMLTGERLATHYASADVFLFPSETETFGNVTLEAMASGLAVVAYDYAAARLHVTDGETGVLAPLGHARAFVEGAVTFARSSQLLDRVRRQARGAAARAAWPPVVEQFERMLTDAADTPALELAVANEEGA
jgi:glycosyltransferase involved in cell wall biosynthesis